MRRLLPATAVLAALILVPAASAKTRTIACAGGADRCTATLALAGLKSGDRVIVNLTDTDLQLRAITPSAPKVQAAYGFGGLSTRLGGSQFVARMLINPPVPAGATVRFRFAVPPKMTACGDDRFTIDGSAIHLRDVQARGLDCLAARRAVEGCVSGVGPGRGFASVLQVDDLVILQGKGRRVTFGLGDAPSSCAPSG